MLYDVFISHASEDKEEIARPLAERLREHRVEVWYDEFSLSVGMSLTRSIDRGLAKSRYGIVILSPHFFGKKWPEWELQGLVQRHLSGSNNVLLPIWHRIGKEELLAYSPSLADMFAIKSSLGVDEVTRKLLAVLQPEESALVAARNLIIARGYEPPVISDDWWLDVIESSGWQNQQRWCLPLWRMTSESSRRGENLAWIVMQHLWQQEAESCPITQMTPPSAVLDFVSRQPGLREVCECMPEDALEFAPQLAIPRFGGFLEPFIEAAYERSVKECELRRARRDRFGSGVTTNGLSPACGDCFALRHPAFGDYQPADVACGFVQGHGAGLGPHIIAFPVFDYLVWLLSHNSAWLPGKQRSYLLQGMKDWAVWPWSAHQNQDDYAGRHIGALDSLMMESKPKKFKLTADAAADLTDRIAYSRKTLGLPESVDELVSRFQSEAVIEAWFATQERRRKKRSPKRRSVT